MNGGFGPSDKLGNLYYNRGFCYEQKTKTFLYNNEYLCECLFREFSHPIVNKLVDKYFEQFQIDEFYEEAVHSGLPRDYQNKKVFLYEYFVRANANVLVKKYYPNATISLWIIDRALHSYEN